MISTGELIHDIYYYTTIGDLCDSGSVCVHSIWVPRNTH